MTDTKAFEREQCAFGPDSTIEESFGDYAVQPEVIANLRSKVKHIFVILRENRSFDHMLGAYRGPTNREQHIPLTGTESNPDPSKRRAQVRFHEEHYCTRSPGHEWNDVHLQYNGGRLDGFVTVTNDSGSNGEGCVAMGYYDERDIPLYYWLADEFAISESYHSSLLGPTLPNLLFYFYATSCNATGNTESAVDPWVTDACDGHRTIFDLLSSNGKRVQVYGDQRPTAKISGAALLAKYFDLRPISDLEAALANPSTLADIVFVEPNYKNGGNFPPGIDRGIQNDEHPPSNIQDGQVFIHRVLSAIMNSPAWDESVVFITWDEHGGYYDHVVPPKACAPDPDEKPATFDFEQLGFRTPFFAISPYARQNYASTITSDHTSILRFIEAWAGVGALTKRDANAWPLFDMFDFSTKRTDSPALPAFTKSAAAAQIGVCGTSGNPPSSCVGQP